jgi:hypothetical protein
MSLWLSDLYFEDLARVPHRVVAYFLRESTLQKPLSKWNATPLYQLDLR